MAFCYIVRCRFTEPSREQAWNAWYSGPKMEQMLAQPHFLTCQRFRLMAGRGRGYLTLWTVDSPQALATPQYTAQWGFAEWAPYVADWSRDLFDGGAASEQAFAVEQEGALAVVAFDRMSPQDADAARAAVARNDPEMMWLPVIGLDRHTPLIGLRPVADMASAHPANDGAGVQVQPAIYRPITRVYSAPSIHLETDDR